MNKLLCALWQTCYFCGFYSSVSSVSFLRFLLLFRRATEPFKPCYYPILIVIPFSIAFRKEDKLFNIILNFPYHGL